MLDFRKLMLCYRLIHYREPLANLEVNLENRDKELAYPLLQLFYGTSVFEEVKESLEYFINQRHERKSNSLEAALYPVIEALLHAKYDSSKEKICNFGELMFSEIWDSIVTNGYLPGYYDPKRPNEYDTTDYGKLYKRTISNTITDAFGARINHRRAGNQLVFDLRQFKTFKDRYAQEEDRNPVTIDAKESVNV
jgi:hypothetical protein